VNGNYKTKKPTRSTKLSNNLTFSHIFPLQNQLMFQKFLLANNPSLLFKKKLFNVYVKISKPFISGRRHGTVLFSEAVKFTQIHKEAQS